MSDTAAAAPTYEKKNLPDGSPNPKYVDLCDEDPPVAGQKFMCVSFISPEKIIKQRELYLFEKFVADWDFSKSMEKFSDFLHFISYKYNIRDEDLMADMKAFVADEQDALKSSQSVTDSFKNFLDANEDKLNEAYNREHNFQTSVRGLKVRGVFNSQEEAEFRCKKLREMDPNHDIFVGPVGVWIPFDPDAYKTGRVEFMEEELNQLHHEKIKNEEQAKQEFDRRVKEAKRAAIEENIAKAKATGATLTQTITEQGDLVGVKETVDFDSREAAAAAPVPAIKSKNDELLEKTESKKRV